MHQPAFVLLASPLLAVTALGVFSPAHLSAQMRVDLDAFESCDRCLELVEVVTLGNVDPPGAIRHDATRAEYSSDLGVFALWVRGSAEVDLFARDGTYLRTVGPAGEGPGESNIVAAVRFFGSKLYVWDPALGRVTAFDVDGDGFEELSPAVTGATDIEILSEEAIAFAGSMFTREAAGFPLHVVEKSDPTMVIHTGVGQAAWNAAEPWGQVVHSALGPDRKVWLARQPRLEFREWSEAGGVERIASGEPDWFPPVVDIPRQGEVPRTRLDDFVVDDAGRIWVLTRVAGANWRAGLGGTSEGGLPGLIDRAVYADHRVDVFDLAEAKHAGHVLVDNPMTHMLLIDGEAHVAHVTYDAAFTPRLSVSRLSVDAR